ncbi:MAG: BON domain-containing protein [Chloroflexi bacterium]|nr:BON domain-containing protein [Chloroflexota bacterium]
MAEELFQAPDDLSEADRRLFASIRKTLWEYEPLRASRPQLQIDVREGRVSLSGRVRTSALKEIAEYSLLHLPGIRAVRNDLLDDPEVVRAVADAFGADPELGPSCLRVDSRYGEVRLTGNVLTKALEARAIEIASNVPLVASVRSLLVVGLPPEAADADPSIAMPTSIGDGHG